MRLNPMFLLRAVAGQAGLMIAAVVLLARSLAANELPPDFAWVQGAGGTNSVRIDAVASDTNGNIYATGVFIGPVDFGAYPLNTVASSGNMFLAKLDATGNWLWVRQAGNTNAGVSITVRAGAVTVDSHGELVVSGYVSSPDTNTPAVISFGTTNVAFNQNGQNNEVFVAKYDATGNCLWARNTGGHDPGYSPQVATDPSNNVYVCSVYFTNNGYYFATNVFVLLKLDPDGNELYRIQPISGGLITKGVQADSQGNAYICGQLGSTTVFNGLTLTSSPSTPSSFVAKLDANGNPVWGISTVENNSTSFPLGVVLDSKTNLLVAGYTSSTNFFGFPILPTGGFTNYKPFVLKLTPDGQILWLRSAYSANCSAYAISVDAADSIYLTGKFSGTADFSGTILNALGDTDVFVAKYSADGELRWALQAGGTNSNVQLDSGTGVATCSEGVIVAGLLWNVASFGSVTLTNSGSSIASFIGLIPHPTPQLDIGAAGDNLLLSWPTFPSGYQLEKANLLDTPTLWTSNAVLPTLLNGTNLLTLPMTNDHQFFRLRKP